MAKRFVVPFAATGDKTVTPDATDPAGAVSYSQGWGAPYQLPNSDPAYRPVGRQEMNGILNDITGAVAELQTQGLPSWVAVTGLVQPYAINAMVRHNNANWQSQIANNSDTPGVGPGATSWKNMSVVPQGLLLATQRFTSSGTYTPTPGMRIARVRIVGGGGGSGIIPNTTAAQYAAAGGGASGSYGEAVLTAVQIGASQAITIGAAGAAGAAGNPGGSGGASSVGTLLSCPGGGGSPIGSVIASTSGNQFAPGDPGAAPSGSASFTYASAGEQGAAGISILSATRAGTGGSSPFGCGGVAQGSAGSAQPGSGYGAGASGPASAPSQPAKGGAAGSAGLVIIEEFT